MTDKLQSFDPASEALVWEGPVATADNVRQAVDDGRKALTDWAMRPQEERFGIARAYADVLKQRSDEIAELISRETGKPLWETRSEVASMIGKVDLSIAALLERAGEKRSDMPFGEAVLRHRPHGVMAVLGPYNFPGHLPNGHIVPALIAGNTVVFKPSELTPASGDAMVSAWREAGIPDGVLSIVQGGKDTGAALVEADIDGLLFTGAAHTGAHFRKVFADRPQVILALELGGNNPLIAWDGDVEEAASTIVQSAFITAGQRCSCARRLIIPKGAYGDQLIEAVAALRDKLMIGAWNEQPEPFTGPLISAQAAQDAKARVAALIGSGVQAIRPLTSIEGRSAAFVTPAILDMSNHIAPDEEIFAPVLQVTRVTDFDAAIVEANRTRFGLSAGLISADDGLWDQFLLRSRAGVVNRNRPTTGAASSMPFGGLGRSGNHRPSAYYAADYCAYPMASFEARTVEGNSTAIASRLRP